MGAEVALNSFDYFLSGLARGALCSIIVASSFPAAAAVSEKNTAKLQLSGPLLMIVSLSSQRMTVYGAGGALASTRVSSGMEGHRTPTGIFSVIQKEKFHRSNIYSGAPMPFMQRITWSGIALHAGVLPGYPASHGCIRMPYDFATQFYTQTRIGARVVVTPHDVEAVHFDHPKLPKPLFTDATTPALAGGDGPRVAVTSLTTAAVSRRINPAQRAVQTRADAQQRLQLAQNAAKAAIVDAQAKSAAAVPAALARNEAEDAAEAAQAKLEAAEQALTTATSPEARERAAATRDAAAKAATEAQSALRAAIDDEQPKRDAAFSAALASKAADAEVVAASDAYEAASKGLEPISVFVSRKEGKVFVRQGFRPMYEAPVTIADPDASIGTHTFLATAPNAAEAGLEWLAVSMPGSAAEADVHQPIRRISTREPAAVVTYATRSAAEALDRITLSPETAAYIADRVWVGGSLTISDERISGETEDNTTDFVVLTR